MTTASSRTLPNEDANAAHELFEAVLEAAREKASDDPDDNDLMLLVNGMSPGDALAALKTASLPSTLVEPIAAALELLDPDTYAPTGQTPASDRPAAPGTGVLWQNLADALNALIAARQAPDFHNLYGPRNDWRHQPYATGAHAHAPWVILDLATRRFTVTSQEQALSGEHSRREHG